MDKAQRDICRKKRVLEHAARIGNVRKTCRYFGVAKGRDSTCGRRRMRGVATRASSTRSRAPRIRGCARRNRSSTTARPRAPAALRSQHPWEERFDLGPLRVGHMDAASGHECCLRPG